MAAQSGDVPRLEAGAQFTSLSVNAPRPVFNCCVIYDDDFLRDRAQGVGGRFTYNFSRYVAVEAEVNFLQEPLIMQPKGRILQGQFGPKVGWRGRRFGAFAKARPGFVDYSRDSLLVRRKTFTFDGRQLEAGDFRVGHRSYAAVDVGGGVEYYPARRVVVRADVGDTIVRYGRRYYQGYEASRAIIESVPETKHNLQISVGVGFRFR